MECKDLQCKQNNQPLEKCSEYDCLGYKCMEWSDKSSKHCQEFDCTNYAMGNEAKEMECKEFKCKPESFNIEENDEKPCKKFGPPVPQKVCLEYESVHVYADNHAKPKCKRLEIVNMPKCLEYSDVSNDGRQCKTLGPAVPEKHCFEYASLSSKGDRYVKPKCKHFVDAIAHRCIEYFPIAGSEASAICVAKGKVCDGIKDCPNGRDESRVTCGMYQYMNY